MEQRVAQHGEPVSFASGTHHLVGECFVPSADDQPPPWAGVVVLHEAFGLTDDIRVFGRRFADLGYLTLAPDLYSWGLTVRCIVDAFRSMFNRSGPAFDDIDAARARCWRPTLAAPVGSGSSASAKEVGSRLRPRRPSTSTRPR